MKYRKKPLVIEAVQYLVGCGFPSWLEKAYAAGTVHGGDGAFLVIETLEGPMRASAGDWIIRGIRGELYACKPDIFEATYEPVR